MHELDISTDANGIAQASFATAITPAWHQLGTVFKRPMTVVEAMDVAHLARWDVRTLPMTSTELVEDDNGEPSTVLHTVKDWVHVVRTNPVNGRTEQLGVVGHRFTHVQNEEHGEFLEALLDMSGARFIETAGALRGGRQVFYSAKLPEPMLIGGVDRHDLYVVAMNGHDGSMALRVIATPVRVVCANTQAAALRTAAQQWSTRHTAGATKAIQDARTALNMTFKFNAEFEREAEKMMNSTIAEGEFEKIVAGLFKRTDKEQGERAAKNAVERFAVIRRISEGPTVGQFAGTRWGWYNALTEYTDHHIDARGKNPETKANGRALAAVAGAAVQVKARAFELLSV